MGGFISYFSYGSDKTLSDAYWNATGLIISFALYTIVYLFSKFYLYEINCKIRVACSGLIYRKAMDILKSSNENGQTGKIVNLLSNDVRKFDDVLVLIYNVWRAPLQIILFVIVTYMEIGVAAFVGMGFLTCFVPAQGKTYFHRSKPLYSCFEHIIYFQFLLPENRPNCK